MLLLKSVGNFASGGAMIWRGVGLNVRQAAPCGALESHVKNQQKQRYYLLRGDRITAENLAAFYRALTGKIASPQAVEEWRRALEQAYRELEVTRSAQCGEAQGDTATERSDFKKG
jgi:hypothetical protein